MLMWRLIQTSEFIFYYYLIGVILRLVCVLISRSFHDAFNYISNILLGIFRIRKSLWEKLKITKV
jgi:hypothetical protein